jgi:protein gp37
VSASTIEWTDETWNPTTGCDRVSPGCDNCYALTMAKRLKGMEAKRIDLGLLSLEDAKYQTDGDPRTSGLGFGIAMHEDAITAPMSWKRPRKVFVNSMSDLFHDGVSDEFLAKVFAVMAATPQHTYQILTKRHGRMRSMLSNRDFADKCWYACAEMLGVDPSAPALWWPGWPLPNVWLGVSVEDQKRADLRIPALLDTPAAVRFLSSEPLLGPVDLTRHMPAVDYWDARETEPWGIHWVIVGGESGHGARPMHPDWVRTLRDQCAEAEVPFFFKQWGEHLPVSLFDDDRMAGGRAFRDPRGGTNAAVIREHGGPFRSGATRPLRAGDENGFGVMLDDDTLAVRVGKKAAGRELDGRTHDEFPGRAA